MNHTPVIHNPMHWRLSIITGLFAIVFLIYLAGDIWVWKGAMLGELAAWVVDEGGEQAFWGASLFYSIIVLLAFSVALFNARLFRWLVLVIVGILAFMSLLKLFGGFAEYSEVGWYFLYLFSATSLVNLITFWCAWRWVKLSSEPEYL